MPTEVLAYFAALGFRSASCGECRSSPAARPSTPPIGSGSVPGRRSRARGAIAGDGEVLAAARCDGGYRNDPEEDAEAIDPDGWLHTGDIGELDDEGYLKIVDRKKELIINAAGKNMSPANIESRLKGSSPLIGQCICVGDRRPYNVALIVLDPDACSVFAAERGLDDGSATALTARDDMQAAVAAAVEQANSHLSRVEQIKRFAILPTDWTPDSDELTPTMKLKRKPIQAKYEHEIEELYT